MSDHINIPIFIPHLGCPNCCVFCNQRTISGVHSFDLASVVSIIEEHIASSPGKEREVAFFGGSFTGIDKDLMISLLEIAYQFVKKGDIIGIRCSTRPDYIDEEIISILKKYGVKTVELGIQSVSEHVLLTSKRGHSFETTKRACALITQSGIELVGQMMIGLPGSSIDDEIDTARFIVNSGATGARVYPTVVFKNTELCQMTFSGEYTPLTVDEAVQRSAAVCKIFFENQSNVLRIGLCSSESVLDDNNYHDGPMHPALGELVENEIYYEIIKQKIHSLRNTNDACLTVFIPKGTASKAIGQRKKNKIRLMNEFGFRELRFVEDDSIKAFDEISVQERKRTECT